MLHDLFQLQTWMMFGVWLVLGFVGHVLDLVSYKLADVGWSKLDNHRSLWLMIFGGPCYLAAAFLTLFTAGLRCVWGEDLSDDSRWNLPNVLGEE